ncbi:unnamed protein product, partial [Pylaiella littoralis]
MVFFFLNLPTHQCVRLSPDKDLEQILQRTQRVKYVYQCFYTQQPVYRCSSPEGIRLNK